MSGSKLSKPQEFWIYDIPCDVAENTKIRIVRAQPAPKDLLWQEYHVIEHSAFETAVKALKNIAQFKFFDSTGNEAGFSAEALNAQRALEKLGIEV